MLSFKTSFKETFFLAMTHGLWDLSSLIRDGTPAPCSGTTESQPLEAREVLNVTFDCLEYFNNVSKFTCEILTHPAPRKECK